MSQVMSACAKAGKWWTTLALLQGVSERRLVPDEVLIGAPGMDTVPAWNR